MKSEVSMQGAPPGIASPARKRSIRHRPWKNEAIRKSIHLAMVVLPAWIWWSPESWRSHGLLLASLAVLTADLLRRVWSPWAHAVDRWALPYTRPSEGRLWWSVHGMFLSAWILSWSVSRDIAVGSLCYGVFGDAAAALVGWQQNRSSSKSLRGSLACFVTCVAVGWLLFPTDGVRILAGAASATLLERFSGPVDDNLTIPLGSALVLSFVA
jgi:dolichol kinase